MTGQPSNDEVLEVPHRKPAPLWLQISGWGALLYMVLWGATFVSALKHLREERQSLIGSGMIELPKEFDASHVPPALSSKDERKFFFIGRGSCPCPLIVTYDFAYYSAGSGFGGRQTTLVFLGWSREQDRRQYWRFLW